MNNEIKNAFDTIKAEDKLKQETLSRIHPAPKCKRRNKMIATALLLVLLFTGVFSTGSFFTAKAYVDIDVIPAIALTLNRYNRVLSAQAYNQDGETLLTDLKLQYKTYQEATQLLLDRAITLDMVPQDGLLSVSVQSDNQNQQNSLLDLSQTSLQQALKSHDCHTALEVYSVSSQDKQQAHDHHMSTPKYLALQELQQVDPNADLEDYTQESVDHIRQQVRQHQHHNDQTNQTTTSPTNTTNAHHENGQNQKGKSHK